MNHEPENDDELFLRLQTGDVLAYEEIYHRYDKFLLQAAYNKIRDKTIAEDLVQNIFISIWEKRASLEVKDTKNYLLGCLKYAVINYIRAQVMENKYLTFAKESHPEELEQENITSAIELQDLSDMLNKGINTLPDKTKEIFKLSRFEHQSVRKISLGLHISEKSVLNFCNTLPLIPVSSSGESS